MSNRDLTLMAVHAHPDDEAMSTGGILHRYGLEGVRTVLVTCTGGELGDGPGGVKPDQPGHDEVAVREMRKRELAASGKALGVSHLELLGYLDSGMEGWAQNGRPSSLSGTPLAEEVAKLESLIERYQPQVVVTYDERGGYAHPDHIRAHDLARAATLESGVPAKLYYTALPKSLVRTAMAAAAAAGLKREDLPDFDFDPEDPPFGVEDDLITTVVDVSADLPAKMESLRCHASQMDNAFMLNLPDVVVGAFMGREHFIRAFDRNQGPLPETDLFAGLR
jgi:LmbE family N-acetylglucosaminyl deacetylase